MPVHITPLTPLAFLERSASVFADRVAVVDGAERMTYRDLAARVTRTAHALRASGIGPGERVAYLCPNTPELLEIRDRLISLFLVGPDGRRPCFGWVERFQTDPAWKDNILFYEYFHGDNGAGLGAMHQTGWTGLVADLIVRQRGGRIPTLGELIETGLREAGA